MTETHRKTIPHMGTPPILTFAKHAESDAYRNLIKHYAPPVKDWEPLIDGSRSTMTIACITEDDLYDALHLEAQTTALTPHTYKHYLESTEADLLLVESAWTPSTGHWHLAQHPFSPEHACLLDVLSNFQKRAIPTVFWDTKGQEYHDHFKTFAARFDHVFSADPVEVELLRSDGVPAELLLPCVQPMLYNPFRFFDQADAFKVDVLFDGWADIDRFGKDLQLLEAVKEIGLSIIETRYDIPSKRLSHVPALADCILGCVSSAGKRNLLKYANTYLTCEPSLASRVSTQWRTLEAAASRVPIVHFGAIEKDDCRSEVVSVFASSRDIVDDIERLQKDVLYREKKAHLGWREVFKNYTIADRLDVICQTAGISSDWQAFPQVTIVSPTYRAHMIETCISTYERQTYPNKELIIVFNGETTLPESLANKISADGSIRLISVPSEMFTGACMNLGIHCADTPYIFKMDDDDWYGDNYVLDLMLYNRAVRADVICKPNSSFYTFEDEDGIYLQKGKIASHTINYLTSHSVFRNYLVAGNSISLMSDRVRSLPFDDHSYGAADASFIYSCAASNLKLLTVDRLNMVINRRNDLSSHTWKEEKLAVKDRLELITKKAKDVLI